MADEVVGVTRNKKVILKDYVSGYPKESDMYVTTDSTVSQGCSRYRQCCSTQKHLLVMRSYDAIPHHEKLHLSPENDQFVYIRIYCTPGSSIRGYGVSQVVDSSHAEYKQGDLVWGLTTWEEYSLITDVSSLVNIHHTDVPLSYYTGLLGMAGKTAYAGFSKVCPPNKGDRVLVSAASGAVGQLIGQFAKLAGCYVVGSAGSKQKVDLLKNKLGFDEAFNYKEETDLDAALKRYFPEGIDVYFEHVGGKLLDAVLLNMKDHGRIAVCGMISQCNLPEIEPLKNLLQIALKRLNIHGFTHRDYDHIVPEYYDFLLPYILQGKIVYVEDITQGLENGPAALVGLFTGSNFGKQVVAVAPSSQPA